MLEELQTYEEAVKFSESAIHRMQIWRTTRSSPGTSHESEASEASVFVLTMLPLKSLAS